MQESVQYGFDLIADRSSMCGGVLLDPRFS